MNFTEEIKNEIISTLIPTRRGAVCLLSAFIRTSGSLISRTVDGEVQYGFQIVTENERTAEFISELCESLFGLTLTVSEAKFDIFSGKDKFAFECVSPETEAILKELHILGEDGEGKYAILGISDDLVDDEEGMIYYLKGAFLGGGSCTLPDEGTYSRTGYHFEIVLLNRVAASGLCDILAEFEVLAKLVSRKEWSVVYVKSKEVISDLLHIMSCFKSLERLSRVVEIKDKQNNANRVNNCSVSNIDKTVMASVKQVQAIEIISATIGLKSLDKPLFDVATCRLLDTNASMQELANRLDITKSCLNHRMRKILEIAGSLSQD